MNKKLMLLATGVLAALAFAALPAVASAGEYIPHCETGAVCEGTITGGKAELKNDAGEGINCSAVHGTAIVTSTSSTGSIALDFTGCKENITGFGFSCTNTGTAGKITTGSMDTHLIYIEHNAGTPGVKITLPTAGVTFSCAGFAKKTVTGKVIGEWETPNCNSLQSTHTINFLEASTGVQTPTQATTTGPTTDLISNNDAGGAYTTSAQTGTGTIHWINNRVNFTC